MKKFRIVTIAIAVFMVTTMNLRAQENTNGSFFVDISALPQGVYLLRVIGFDSEYNNIQKVILL